MSRGSFVLTTLYLLQLSFSPVNLQGTGAVDCSITGCQNGGLCLDTNQCQCVELFLGNQCEKYDCLNGVFEDCGNGFCHEADNGCICRDGYTGAQCSIAPTISTTPRDHCIGNPCANGGSCINNLSSYECECTGPWIGINCTRYDPCRVLTCNHGFCKLNSVTGKLIDPGSEVKPGEVEAECRCQPGWQGAACDADVNECVTGEGGCLNGGSCRNVPGGRPGFMCDCPPLTSGQFCEIDANGQYTDPCASNPCKNAASCLTNQPWKANCLCKPGWAGEFCDQGACAYDRGYEYEYDYGFEYEGRPPPDFASSDDANYAYYTSEDYCLFGGECTVPDSQQVPRCKCALGYTGDRCFYRTTILTRVHPLIGPKSGGTEVTFTGINMNRTKGPSVYFESVQCPLIYSNDTDIVCKTLPANDIGVPLNVSITWRNGDPGFLDVQEDFTYLKDPTISDIQPTETIISGGVILTVTGEGLNVIGKPRLQITVVYRSQPIHVFTSDCTVQSSTIMLCPTPKLQILNEDGQLDLSNLSPPPTSPPSNQFNRKRRSLTRRDGLHDSHAQSPCILSILKAYVEKLQGGRHRRQAQTQQTEFQINNETVEFHIGFELDGVQTYRNLTETLPQVAMLTVYVDPVIDRWDSNQIVESNRRELEVEGDRLTVGIQSSDYTMLIGQSKCSKLEVFDNRLICTAPSDVPKPHEADTTDGVFSARVLVGVFKEPFIVGQVTYKTGFFDNPAALWGVIGGAIALGAIILIVIAVCIARKVSGT